MVLWALHPWTSGNHTPTPFFSGVVWCEVDDCRDNPGRSVGLSCVGGKRQESNKGVLLGSAGLCNPDCMQATEVWEGIIAVISETGENVFRKGEPAQRQFFK